MANMINVESLSFNYPDGTKALYDINLEIKEGEVFALMGANGCGKTTLLKHLIGLLKPSSGKVSLNGKGLNASKQEEIFRQIGMVFQDPNDQLFAATVEQDVAFGVSNLGIKPEDVSQRIETSLKLVEAHELKNKAIHTLSFGQKRRVAIAGVLAMEPRIMLLDEPTSGLDPRSISSIMKLLWKLNHDKRITMVMATHDVELIPLFCTRVAIMSHGSVVATGPPKEIFADVVLLREAGMRLPRIAHLTEILQKKDGLVFPERPLTIGEARKEFHRMIIPGNEISPVKGSKEQVK
jgi:cobalt/nickel transport system ATP-binding protein